jgi:hypothetical protein
MLEICVADPGVGDFSPFEAEIIVAQLKIYKLLGSDHILA